MAGLFLDELIRTREEVWSRVRNILPYGDPQFHYDLVREYPERKGKYIRPTLLLLGTELFGGTRLGALPMAAAYQLSEEWLLIHDDIEDRSIERRSTAEHFRPSLHYAVGDALALNAGDALHILMWRAVGQAVRKMPQDIGTAVYDKMVEILLLTTEGQAMELGWIHTNTFIDEKEYYTMVSRKTAEYTAVGPLTIGALLAGVVDKAVFRDLALCGREAGYAFQILDDVLNITTESVVSGKERGGDVREGKRTLLLIHLLEHCTSFEKQCIEGIYRRPYEGRTNREIAIICTLFQRYGSIEYALEKVRIHTENAITLLDELHGVRDNIKATLAKGIRFLGERSH